MRKQTQQLGFALVGFIAGSVWILWLKRPRQPTYTTQVVIGPAEIL
jgi:hypothetical protein